MDSVRARVASVPAVQDLQPLVPRSTACGEAMCPSAARSFYDEGGNLQLVFES